MPTAIPTLQSLISTTRNTLRDLHIEVEYCITCRHGFRAVGKETLAQKFHEAYVRANKRIQKLARTQKWLKKELADAIDFERFMRNFPDAVDAYNLYETNSHI